MNSKHKTDAECCLKTGHPTRLTTKSSVCHTWEKLQGPWVFFPRKWMQCPGAWTWQNIGWDRFLLQIRGSKGTGQALLENPFPPDSDGNSQCSKYSNKSQFPVICWKVDDNDLPIDSVYRWQNDTSNFHNLVTSLNGHPWFSIHPLGHPCPMAPRLSSLG